MNLTEKMSKWEELQKRADELAGAIKEEVLALGKSQAFGNVKATFTKGRGRYNYEAIAQKVGAPESVVKENSKTVVDWKSVVDAINAPDDVRQSFYEQGSPSVSLKLA